MSDLAHSAWGASKFESIMLCPGKVVLEDGLPNTTSVHAAEGTAAHQVLTWALQENRPASAYIGRIIMVEDWSFEVDAEMAEHVQVTIDYVLCVAGEDGVVLVDQRVDYSRYLGLPAGEAWGTLDVAVLRDNVITGIDLKYGRGVEVYAGFDKIDCATDESKVEPNPQVALYNLGILDAVQGLLGDFDTARLVICQPRVSKTPSEYEISVADLEAWGHGAAKQAVAKCRAAAAAPHFHLETWRKAYLKPGEKQCKFCRAKATCPALRNEVVVHVSAPAAVDEFESITDPKTFTEPDLSRALSKCDLIETWCASVRAEVERRLLAATPVPGFKLVQGKRGNRKWSKPEEAEAAMKSMRLKECEMYEFSLISPTTAEKRAKDGTIGPRQWLKLKELVVQTEGKPHVAPDSDPRPALELRPVIDDFEALA